MDTKNPSHAAVSLTIGLLLAFCLALVLLSFSANAQADSASLAASSVTRVHPPSAANDLNTTIAITGTGFTASLSGAVVITLPMVYLDSHLLPKVAWISSTLLTATVPWGLDPGAYTLTVVSVGGQSSFLINAFTVTKGLDVWTTDGPYGGGSAPVINPVAPTLLFANASSVGVFRSQDSGQHWQQVLDAVGGGATGEQVVFNSSGDTVYAAGENGAYRSMDGGDTWDHIPWPHRVFPHPISDTVVYGGVGCDTLMRSDDSAQSWTWTAQGLTGTTCSEGELHVVFHPTNPQTMYAGLPSGDIFISEDGGKNWTFASRPVGDLWSMAVNPFGAHELWVGSRNHFGYTEKGLVKSTNAELTTWTELEEEPGRKLLSVLYIRFPPVTWGEAYSGTVYLPFGVLKKTTDGGSTWTVTELSVGLSDLALYPTDTERMYTGGVQLSLDGGQTWSPMNEGLAAVVPTELAAVPNRPETVYALTGDSVYASQRAGESWKLININAEAVATDPFATSRVYLGKGDSKGDFENGIVLISNDGGVSWPISGVLAATSQYSDCHALVQVIEADPVNPGRLLAGLGYFCGDFSNPGGGLYLSTDWGENWSHVNVAGLTSQVNDIVFDPQNPAAVYAGTFGGGLFASSDGGATWQATENLMSGKNIGSLAAEPAAPYRIYAAGQYGDIGIYRSDDGGATWLQADTKIGGVVRRGLAVMPGSPQVVYAATSGGLWVSEDSAASWWPHWELLNVPIHALAVAADDERAILYISSGGGPPGVAQNLVAASSKLGLAAGVFRTTKRLNDFHVYLPLIVREHVR